MAINSFIASIKSKPQTFYLKKPFITAAGRKTKTHNVQILLTLSNGIVGFGEASTSIAMKEQSQAMLLKVLNKEGKQLKGLDFNEPEALIRSVWKRIGDYPAAAAAVECAILDAQANGERKPLWKRFGTRAKTIETDLTLSLGHPDEVAKAAQDAVRQGFRRIKVKLAGDARWDWVRLKAVHSVAPKARLVADGNQGFTLKSALDLDHRLSATRVPVYFFEQPFPRGDMASMKRYRAQAKLPLVADESVRTASEARKLLEAGAIDGINIKVAKSGLLESLGIILLVRRHKKILSIGCMEESKRGLAPSVHLACGTGVFDWVDLDSAHLLKEGRVAQAGFTIKGPFLSVQ